LNKFLQVLLSLLPLLLTPAIAAVLAGDFLHLGGGEKDVLWAFFWAIWAVIFFVSSIILIVRKWDVKKWMNRSAVVATSLLFLIWLLALTASFLGLV
jgi:hypothetical protein